MAVQPIRPALTADTPEAQFRRCYWLKEELLAFCRARGLSSAGSKTELAERIAEYLRTGAAPLPTWSGARSSGPMPDTFSRHSVIGPGWRCTQALRSFFVAEIGPGFRFDAVMRDFIARGEGRTLQQAIDAWHAPRPQTAIAPQFEYNRHMRAYHVAHPGATRDEAIRAWNEHKARRRPDGPGGVMEMEPAADSA